MKKAFCVLMAVMFLCAVPPASADQNDPIVGLWYILFSKDNTPESLWEVLDFKADRLFVLFDFQPDGEVFAYDILLGDNMGTPESEFFAKWENTSEDYLISMIGSKKFKAYFKEEDLYCDLFGSEIYLKFGKAGAIDWFEDIIR